LNARDEELRRLGIDPSDPDAADSRRLAKLLLDRGAGHDELVEAVRAGALGPLSVELALRPPGEAVPFEEAAEGAGLDAGEAAGLWRAMGFPDPSSGSVRLTPVEVDTLKTLSQMGESILGRETTVQLARVIGGVAAQLAEAVVDAFRVKFEMPRRRAGEPYAEVVEQYTQVASVMFPALAQAVTDVLRAHLIGVARSAPWALDEEQSAITRERTVGFADLVGYTRSTRNLSPSALAGAIERFESYVAELVAGAGGRVVKLIGDEAMFVVEDPGTGCELALELADRLRDDPELPSVSVGLAAGPVVAHHGDYYGDVVNLAARLVKAAGPDEVLVSAPLARSVEDGVALEPAELPELKGYEPGMEAFRLRTSGGAG
jgi:adenylate cyclase